MMNEGHGQPDLMKTRIANSMAKARILMEALPYIRQFQGRVVVIKYGGAAMDDPEFCRSFAGDVTLLSTVGIHPVIVHGGGPRISAAMEREGLESTWIDGLRVTDQRAIEVVQQVLIGDVNVDIVRMLAGQDANAIGISGIDAGLLRAKPKDEHLGFVGEVTGVNGDLIRRLIAEGLIPVVAPLARGEDGMVYNCNADTAAAALAQAISAQKLVYLTDIDGVYRDPDDDSTRISRMSLSDLHALVPSVTGGMRPKLESVIAALEGGVGHAHILDGRVQHSILLEIFTPEGIGTMFETGAR